MSTRVHLRPALAALAALAVALVSGTGCTSTITNMETPTPDLDDVPLVVDRKLDVLFVVDNSSSMRQEQDALAGGFARFVDRLQSGTGELPDLHIGVVSSNVGTGPEDGGGEACLGQGDDGVLQVPDGCAPLTDDERFIHDGPAAGGGRDINYEGSLTSQFACMARLGTVGCGFEMHLESMRRALSNDVDNAGFRRPGAPLAVVIVGDEDDCSASDRYLFSSDQDSLDSELGQMSSFRCFEFGTTCDPVDGGERSVGSRQNCVADDQSPYIEPVSTYIDFLEGLVDDPHKLFVAAITGDTTPVTVTMDESHPGQLWLASSCTVCPDGTDSCGIETALVSAAPAVRFHALTDALGPSGAAPSICAWNADAQQLDFGAHLAAVADSAATRLVTRCLAADPLDLQAGTPGVQATCEAADATAGESSPIAACNADASNLPCFRLSENPDLCADTASHLELVVERGPGAAAPAGSTLSLRCALAP